MNKDFNAFIESAKRVSLTPTEWAGIRANLLTPEESMLDSMEKDAIRSSILSFAKENPVQGRASGSLGAADMPLQLWYGVNLLKHLKPFTV